MEFANPGWLGVLLIVPVLAARAVRADRRRLREWRAFGGAGKPPQDGSWTWLVAVVFLTVGLSGPRWGRRADPALPSGRELMLLIDVSRSMMAEDAVPDRLGLAVAAAEQVVRAIGHESGSRVGVVAFAGRGVPRCPLTANLGAVVGVIESLRAGTVQPSGTDLGAALEAARNAFGTDPDPEGDLPPISRSIVLISDGEDLTGHWRPVLDRLKTARVPVHTVAVGDTERGHPIPIRLRPDSAREPLRFEGKTVLSRRDDTTLRAIATATDGAFVPLGMAQPEGLDTLFAERIAPEAHRRVEQTRPIARVDRYAVFVLAALLAGLLGPRLGRMPRVALVLTLLFSLLSGAGTMPVGGSAAEAVRTGNRAFAEGHWNNALMAFEHAIELDPNTPIARYNAAATLFQLGRYAEAAARYGEARARADAGLRMKIDFSLGNTAFALGDRSEALRHYDACLASNIRSEQFAAVRRDAAINREFAARYHEPDKNGQETEKPSPGAERPDSKSSSKNNASGDQPSPSKTRPTPHAPSPPESTTPSSKSLQSLSTEPADPRQRLDEAVDRIRGALRQRIPDAPLDVPDEHRKDW